MIRAAVKFLEEELTPLFWGENLSRMARYVFRTKNQMTCLKFNIVFYLYFRIRQGFDPQTATLYLNMATLFVHRIILFANC